MVSMTIRIRGHSCALVLVVMVVVIVVSLPIWGLPSMVIMTIRIREHSCALVLVVMVVVIVVVFGLAQLAGLASGALRPWLPGVVMGCSLPGRLTAAPPLPGNRGIATLGVLGGVIGMYPHPRQAGCITPICRCPASWSRACRLAEPRDLPMA